jgi:hypothetical protein
VNAGTKVGVIKPGRHTHFSKVLDGLFDPSVFRLPRCVQTREVVKQNRR